MSLLTDLLNTGSLGTGKPSPQKGESISPASDFSETLVDVITSAEEVSIDPNDAVLCSSSEAAAVKAAMTESPVETDLDLELQISASASEPSLTAETSEPAGPMTFPEELNDSSEREALTLSMINAGLKVKSTDGIDSKANAQAMTAIAHGGATKTSPNQPPLTGDRALAELEPDMLDELSTRSERAPQAETARVVTDARIAERPVVGLTSLSPTSESLAHRATPTESINESVPRERQPLAGDMATHIRVLKTQGGGEARLNLNPAELGRMSITVITESGETKVAFVVETASARQAIENALPRLREMLEQAGLSLSDSEVAEGHRDAKSESDRRDNSLAEGPSSDASDLAEESLSLSLTLDPERILDTFA